MFWKKNSLNLVQLSFYFLPISLLIGSLVVNINILIFIILTSFYLIQKKIPIKLNITDKLLLSFFSIIILSSLININVIGTENFIKSILLLKFFFIYLFIETLITYKRINLEIFFKICLFLVIFVSLDVMLQFFSGKNILGFEPHDGRIAGIFGSEAIAGAFIQKLFIFSLAGVFLIKYFKNLKIKYHEILFFLISALGTFLASNRMSFLILMAIIIFIFFFYKNFRKDLLISLVFIIPVFLYLYNSNEELKMKFVHLKGKIARSIDALDKDTQKDKFYSEFYSANHGRIYYATFKSFKEDMLLGSGLKSFRYKCFKFKDDKLVTCSTHPHNYHLEVLHDTGIVGFILLSSFVILILFTKFRSFKSGSYNYIDKVIFSLIMLNFLIEIFPIKSTGSLFSTWTGTILWVSVAMINYDKKINGKN